MSRSLTASRSLTTALAGATADDRVSGDNELAAVAAGGE
jgi:hypothetical protein